MPTSDDVPTTPVQRAAAALAAAHDALQDAAGADTARVLTEVALRELRNTYGLAVSAPEPATPTMAPPPPPAASQQHTPAPVVPPTPPAAPPPPATEVVSDAAEPQSMLPPAADATPEGPADAPVEDPDFSAFSELYDPTDQNVDGTEEATERIAAADAAADVELPAVPATEPDSAPDSAPAAASTSGLGSAATGPSEVSQVTDDDEEVVWNDDGAPATPTADAAAGSNTEPAKDSGASGTAQDSWGSLDDDEEDEPEPWVLEL